MEWDAMWNLESGLEMLDFLFRICTVIWGN
jgi:hypothetical protein